MEHDKQASFLLLDKYFKRKELSKLKEIIKVPARLKE